MKSLCFIATLLLLHCLPVQADFTINAAGFSTDVYTHEPDNAGQLPGIVFIPGKGGNPQAGYLKSFYRKLNRAGFEVIAPVMPWKGWKGDRAQAMAVVNEAIAYFSARGKQTVLAGHSMGAMLAMHYAAEQPAKDLLGVVAIAPGHLIHQSRLMRTVTKESIERARSMVAAGNGNDKANFTDIKQGEEYDRYTTASIYLSYYDHKNIPSIKTVLPAMKVPLLWIAGEDDRLTEALRMEEIFQYARKDGVSRYELLTGSHKGVTRRAPAAMKKWIKLL